MNLPPKVSAGMPIKAAYHNAIVDALASLSASRSAAAGKSSSASGSAAAGKYGAMRGWRVIPAEDAFAVSFKLKDGQVEAKVSAGNVHSGGSVWHVEETTKTISGGGSVSVVLEADTDDDGIVVSQPTVDVLDELVSPDCEGGDGRLFLVIATFETEKKTAGSRQYLAVKTAESVRYVNGDVWLTDSSGGNGGAGTGDDCETAFRVTFERVAGADGGAGTIRMIVGPGNIQGAGVRKMREDGGDWVSAGDEDKCAVWVQSTPRGIGSTARVEGASLNIGAGGTYSVVLSFSRDGNGGVSGAKVEIVGGAGSENFNETWNPADGEVRVLIGTYDVSLSGGEIAYASVRNLYGDYWNFPLPNEPWGSEQLCAPAASGTSLRPLEYLGSPYAWTRTGANSWTLANVAALVAENSAVAGTHDVYATIAASESPSCAYDIKLTLKNCLAQQNVSLRAASALTKFAKIFTSRGVTVSTANRTTPTLVYLTLKGAAAGGVEFSWGTKTLSGDLPWAPQEYVQKAQTKYTQVDRHTIGIQTQFCNAAAGFYAWTVSVPMALITGSAAGRNVLIPIRQGFVEARPTFFFGSGSANTNASEFLPNFPETSPSGAPSAAGDAAPYIPSGVTTSDDKIDEADAAAYAN